MAFVKSVLWLTGSSALAYVLIKTITPKDSDISKLLPEGQVHHRPDINKQPTFFEVLKKAANEKPSMIHQKQSSETPSTLTTAEK